MTQRGRTTADLIAENKAIVIIILLFLAGILIWLVVLNIPIKIGSVEIGSNPSIKDTVKSETNVEISGDNNINGNNNNVYQINQKALPKPQNQYRIVGTKNQRLINQIANLKKIQFVPNSRKYIQITYTGAIQSFSNEGDTFYYTGGVVKLIVNDNCTFEFQDFKIEEMRPSSKSAIFDELESQINKYVDSNQKQFLNAIFKCI